MCPWEALVEVFVIFGVPLGSGGAPFRLQKVVLLRSENFMVFGCGGPLHFGEGRRHGRGLWEGILHKEEISAELCF